MLTWKEEEGYTLIELSLILIIIGIILIFALPRLENIEDLGLRSAAMEVAGTIQSVFDEAILKRTPYQLMFDLGERSYSIIGKSVNEGTSEMTDTLQKRVTLPDSIYIKDIVTSLDGRVSEGGITIRFYPDGFVDRNIIHISNGKKDYTLITASLTGKVKVLEGYVDISEGE